MSSNFQLHQVLSTAGAITSIGCSSVCKARCFGVMKYMRWNIWEKPILPFRLHFVLTAYLPGLAYSIPLAIAIDSVIETQTRSMRFNLGTFFFESETLFVLALELPEATGRDRTYFRISSEGTQCRGKQSLKMEMDTAKSRWHFIIWKSCRCCDLLCNPYRSNKWDSHYTRTFITAPAKPPKPTHLLVPSPFSLLLSESHANTPTWRKLVSCLYHI